MKKITNQKILSFFLALIMLHVSAGCNYYMVNRVENINSGLEEVSPDKYVIIHFGSETFNLANLYVDKEANTMSGTKTFVNSRHTGHNYPKPRNNRFKKKYEAPTNEVHIYVNGYKSEDDKSNEISIDIAEVEKMEVYDLQVGATIATYTFTTLGIIAGVIGIILIIVLLTKSSCPFVYIHDGEKYVFHGETYGGAIAQNLERDDFMPLYGIEPIDGEYLLKITNELKEKQYTDVAELLILDHDASSLVGTTQTGELHELKDLIAAKQMIADNGSDLTEYILKHDSVYYGFTDEKYGAEDFSQATIKFDNPTNSSTGKMVLTLKNTLWLDIMLDEFFSQFGSYYNKYQKEQNDVPAEKKMEWMSQQGLMLKVEQRTTEGWKEIDELLTVGPLAPRTLVVPLENLEKTDEVEIRLSTGFHFWEIDFAGMEYSDLTPVKAETVQLSSAIDENENDVTHKLMSVDGNHLDQLVVGSEAFLKFKAPAPAVTGQKRTVFLHTRGYYEYIRDYKGTPDFKKLKEFREPGRFPAFTKELVERYIAVN